MATARWRRPGSGSGIGSDKAGRGWFIFAECAGVDGFVNRDVALKLFSPRNYPTLASYEKDMQRIAQVASIIAGIDQGNLLDIHGFQICDGIRMMIMKRIMGLDLQSLINPNVLDHVKQARSGVSRRLDEDCRRLLVYNTRNSSLGRPWPSFDPAWRLWTGCTPAAWFTAT